MKIGSKEFKKLQKEWYKKLKDDGFKDAEQPSTRDSEFIAPEVFEYNLERVNYYAECNYWLEYGDFPSELHRWIFEKHTEGIRHREIAQLSESYGNKISQPTVTRYINQVLKMARIKPYKGNKR